LTTTNSFLVIVYAPVLASIGNVITNVGQTIAFTASATDNDPAQTPTYSLVTAPAAASIGPLKGNFSWRPGVAHANTTNTIVVQVSDNNVPPLTATQRFKVVVNPLASVTLGPLTATPGNARIEVNGPIGPDYILQASTTLTNGSWTSLLTNTSSSSPFTLTDSPSSFADRGHKRGWGFEATIARQSSTASNMLELRSFCIARSQSSVSNGTQRLCFNPAC
jgi:hypothetical protein